MINQVILIGRLTADPAIRTTTTGKSVCTFNIAVDRSVSKDGEKKTDFITIVTWENTAIFVEKYFRKGSMIAISGSIQTRQYEDRDGNKRTAFEVIAREVSFCGDKLTAKEEYKPVHNEGGYSTAGFDDFEEIVVPEDMQGV